MYSSKIILDSVNPSGDRLTTWELEYPRLMHAELMTHRELSRNAASSRAIPAAKLREKVVKDPVVPVHFGKNQKGMQAKEEVADTEAARMWWLEGLRLMAAHHEKGEKLGLHKQIVNRVIEPWMFITLIVSSTNFENLFFLRCHEDAQPEFEWLAQDMFKKYRQNKPTPIASGGWHLPYIRSEDYEIPNVDNALLKKISAARCARVSYLTHDGRKDIADDLRIHNQLCGIGKPETEPMHMSPFEHIAVALDTSRRVGNFSGWKQYRKEFEREAGPQKFSPTISGA